MIALIRAAILLPLAIVWGCGSVTNDCAGTGVDGLSLSIRDAQTNANIASAATVTVEQLSAPFHSRTGKLTDPPPSPLDLAADRPGPYQLTVTAQGYRTWSERVEVRTTGGACSQTITTNVIALLQPSNQAGVVATPSGE